MLLYTKWTAGKQTGKPGPRLDCLEAANVLMDCPKFAKTPAAAGGGRRSAQAPSPPSISLILENLDQATGPSSTEGPGTPVQGNGTITTSMIQRPMGAKKRKAEFAARKQQDGVASEMRKVSGPLISLAESNQIIALSSRVNAELSQIGMKIMVAKLMQDGPEKTELLLALMNEVSALQDSGHKLKGDNKIVTSGIGDAKTGDLFTESENRCSPTPPQSMSGCGSLPGVPSDLTISDSDHRLTQGQPAHVGDDDGRVGQAYTTLNDEECPMATRELKVDGYLSSILN